MASCNFPNCPRATPIKASERDYRVVIAADAISGVQPATIEFWHGSPDRLHRRLRYDHVDDAWVPQRLQP